MKTQIIAARLVSGDALWLRKNDRAGLTARWETDLLGEFLACSGSRLSACGRRVVSVRGYRKRMQSVQSDRFEINVLRQKVRGAKTRLGDA